MDRRAFIGALTAGAFATASRAATAQLAGSVRHVGILTAGVLPTITPPALVDALRERGWVEGQNLVFDRRGGDGNSERVPALAAELVQMKVDVIVSFGAVAAIALRNATTTIPIVAGVGGTFSGKWDAPEGNGTTLAAQLPNILSGHSYINFHTTQFGGGEIRGAILVVPEPSSLALLGIAALALFGFGNRRGSARKAKRSLR